MSLRGGPHANTKKGGPQASASLASPKDHHWLEALFCPWASNFAVKANQMLPINDTWKMKVDKPLLPISSYNEHFYCLYSKDSQRGTQCLRKFDLKTALNQRRREKNFCPFWIFVLILCRSWQSSSLAGLEFLEAIPAEL